VLSVAVLLGKELSDCFADFVDVFVSETFLDSIDEGDVVLEFVSVSILVADGFKLTEE
jgi:hypothetical protein